jgi:hypothetical protein
VREDYRKVPIDVLRDFALTRSHITSIRACAEEVGIGRSTFHKFVLGRTSPQPRVQRLMALWYLEKKNEVDESDVVRPYASAMATLVSDLEPGEQDAAIREVVASLLVTYDCRRDRPRWLELLAEE